VPIVVLATYPVQISIRKQLLRHQLLHFVVGNHLLLLLVVSLFFRDAVPFLLLGPLFVSLLLSLIKHLVLPMILQFLPLLFQVLIVLQLLLQCLLDFSFLF
jgi:hypothetical protein